MKILIVEDKQNFRNLIGESIEKWGLETVAIEDFTQIFSIFLKERPHLVLLDINLPLYDGFYWCSKIREVSQVPIIYLVSKYTDGLHYGYEYGRRRLYTKTISLGRVNGKNKCTPKKDLLLCRNTT